MFTSMFSKLMGCELKNRTRDRGKKNKILRDVSRVYATFENNFLSIEGGEKIAITDMMRKSVLLFE